MVSKFVEVRIVPFLTATGANSVQYVGNRAQLSGIRDLTFKRSTKIRFSSSSFSISQKSRFESCFFHFWNEWVARSEMVRFTSDIMSISSCFVTFDSVHFEVGRIFELLFWDVVPSFWLKHLWFSNYFVSKNVMGLSAFTTEHE